MNASAHHPPFSVIPSNRQRGAFALVLTLLILSLLVVVAVSYLSSMVGERQTADAFTSETRAEEMAQAGADSAMAILKQSFRDFPDSATVWDPAQSLNADGTPNEGTSLYLRAMPDANGYAETFPTNSAANAAGGNNPNNPACKNFVLPLISGVPGGQAQLVSNKKGIFTAGMNYTVTDPTTQNSVDLNVRRGSGDIQGVIGSPPGWTGSAPNVGSVPAPKPARAYWVPVKSNVKDVNGNAVTTGRYAFWIEDESFRANNNYFGVKPHTPLVPTAPPDNMAQPTPFPPTASPTASPAASPTPAYRSLDPSDSILAGPLTLAGDSNASNDATTIFNARTNYPGKFFPDPLAFMHTTSDSTSSFTPMQADLVRYCMTNQSGTLNLTRHGTQRLNLNEVVTAAITPQNQVDEIVQTMKFHLPYLGERFYRMTATNLTANVLNDATQVPGCPVTPTLSNDHANIYYYKVAANLVDYIDTDSQPTIIDNTGQVRAPAPPTGPLNDDLSGKQIWAQGKEIAPYMQEVAVRYRPVVYDQSKPYPPLQFDFQIDYYVEFWNMSDRDIYAGPNSTHPNLSGAMLHIGNQHNWQMYPGSPASAFPGSTLQGNDGKPSPLLTMGPPTDYDIDLTNAVYQNGSSTPVSGGVVFKAGTCTVITTDPSYMSYVFQGLTATPMSSACPPAGTKPSFNVATTYYCSTLLHNTQPGVRDYKGTVTLPPGYVKGSAAHVPGIEQVLRGSGGSEDADLDVYLWNNSGIIDSNPYALTEYNPKPTSPIYTDTDIYVGTPGSYDDFSYSSCLFGNLSDGNLYYPVTPSQLGDPRTNNEQITISSGYATNLQGDQTRFVYPKGTADTTLGYPNGLSQKPDATVSGYPWPDYYILPAANSVNYPAPDATNAPMVVADAPLTSIGQLGDVFDPARLPGTSGIVYSRGGGRTFKIGQHDDRYASDPTTNATPNNTVDNVPASNSWASWRLADIFDAADPTVVDLIETPARININGIRRDNGAALLSLLQGYVFQPTTAAGSSGPSPTFDPILHGDGHPITGSLSLATKPLDTTGSTNGFAAIIAQMTARLSNPSLGGPFFERGEFGELGSGTSFLFGTNPASAYATGNKLLVSTVDMNKTFDHSREELFRRIAQMICTRGDTFTVYAVGQSITQPTSNNSLKVTGTHRTRTAFRLVPKDGSGNDFHPGYTTNTLTGVNTTFNFDPKKSSDVNTRFSKPDHYDVQVLQTSAY